MKSENQQQPVEDTPVIGEAEFFFKLSADDTGVTELTFRKDAPKVLQSIFFTLDYVNSTFDEPFPTLGEFLRNLADSADAVDKAVAENTKEQQPDVESNQPAEEVKQ